MQIIGRSVGAALAMGNACVLKPAEEACLTALAFARIAHDCGLPAGALNVVPGLGEEAGAALARHHGVQHLSFTGSVAVGQQVQAAAAKNAVPVTLELGGKSPQIVFADADLDAALPFLVNAGVQNAGQTCSAASRILVEAEHLRRRRRAHGRALQEARRRPGDQRPRRGPVDLGAPARTGAKLSQRRARQRPARGGAGRAAGDLPRNGCYVAPTLLAPVRNDHRLAQEEIFGPVQVVISFDGEADAIAQANGTPFGLVAGVWTRDGGRALRVARRLKCGQVFINNYGAGGGVELPFGGVKQSGHGREKGFEALYGFSALKTIAIKHD